MGELTEQSPEGFSKLKSSLTLGNAWSGEGCVQSKSRWECGLQESLAKQRAGSPAWKDGQKFDSKDKMQRNSTNLFSTGNWATAQEEG